MTKLFATVDLFFFFYWILMTTAVRQGWKYCKCHPVFQDRQVTFILAQGQWVRVQEGHLATKQRLAQGKLGLKVLKPCSVQCERVCKINHAIPDIRWYYGHNSGAHSCWKLNDVIFTTNIFMKTSSCKLAPLWFTVDIYWEVTAKNLDNLWRPFFPAWQQYI